MMLSPRETDIVRQVLAPFADGIDRVAVFGSRAMETARPNSDIDLALFGSLTERQLARLWTLFDESSLAVSVDVVDYRKSAGTPLQRHIDAVAKTLFTKDQLKAAA